ncbi:hypothetical protein BDZ89DRAFT_487305 [Hymenopellis radicata]|nr:hypothetical protein BDZ89DRAFT_487305 [Hymenopellis radicata]
MNVSSSTMGFVGAPDAQCRAFTRSAGHRDMNAVGLLMDAMIVVGRIRRLRLCLNSRSCHAPGLSSRLGIVIPVVDQRC